FLPACAPSAGFQLPTRPPPPNPNFPSSHRLRVRTSRSVRAICLAFHLSTRSAAANPRAHVQGAPRPVDARFVKHLQQQLRRRSPPPLQEPPAGLPPSRAW